MSNRITKSKSPQLNNQYKIDKDLMKYHILQKINKPQVPEKQIIKTQPDEEQEPEDFKQEIEFKYKNCQINHTFIFPKEDYESSSDNSLQSLKDTTVYNLNCNNIERLTDATSPYFMKALNEKLLRLAESIEDDYSQQNTIQKFNTTNPKQTNQQKSHCQNQSSTSIGRLIDNYIINMNTMNQNANQNRDSVTHKTQKNQYFRATPTLSSEKKKQSKKILQILKIAQQRKINNSTNNNAFNKRTTQINSYSFNNTHNIFLNGKRNGENMRIKTESDDFEGSLQKFQIIPKSRSKVREHVTKFKKLESSQEYKILNYTMDNHLLEQLGVGRNAKSQNRSYKV
ncbi:unnamed protein product [Paramecium pentaurelia]|uniref:Uncharacterized protein n=1 Tax=Paramecium pentaurelia TaxID=43138 RepID=A0A8S1XDF2_9CILI|nr:unnamed protein product [Paramecium pentaurelia]